MPSPRIVFGTCVLSNVASYGGVVSVAMSTKGSVPPWKRKSTAATPTLSETSAATLTVPRRRAPGAGAVTSTVGPTTSPATSARSAQLLLGSSRLGPGALAKPADTARSYWKLTPSVFPADVQTSWDVSVHSGWLTSNMTSVPEIVHAASVSEVPPTTDWSL